MKGMKNTTQKRSKIKIKFKFFFLALLVVALAALSVIGLTACPRQAREPEFRLRVQFHWGGTASITTVFGGGFDDVLIERDSSIVITAVPSVGNSFVEWREGDSVFSTQNPHSFLMPSRDLNLVAVFESSDGQQPQLCVECGEYPCVCQQTGQPPCVTCGELPCICVPICGEQPCVCQPTGQPEACVTCGNHPCICSVIPPVEVPTNVRVVPAPGLGWALTWNAMSQTGFYDVEIRNTATGATATTRNIGNNFSLLASALNVRYSYRVRAVQELPNNVTNWSTAVEFGIPSPQIPTTLETAFGVLPTLPNGWTWDSNQTRMNQIQSILGFELRTFYASYQRGAPWAIVTEFQRFPFPVIVNDVETPSGFIAIFGETLEDVTLPMNWEWVTESSFVGNAGERTHSARFNPTNTVAFNSFTRQVAVYVTRAVPTVATPSPRAKIVGETVGTVTLPTGWTWDAPNSETLIYGKQYFSATYRRSANYFDVMRHIEIWAVELPSAVATYGDLLAAINFDNSRWSWDIPTDSVGNVGKRHHRATYTPENAEISSISRDIAVTVERAYPQNVEIPYGFVAGEGTILRHINLPENWIWHEDYQDNDVGLYGVRSFPAFYTRNKNFNTVTRNIYVTVVEKVQNEVEFVQVSAGLNSVSGAAHTIALDSRGRVWTWGRNNFGQLGNGQVVNQSTLAPTMIIECENLFSLPRMVFVAAGGQSFNVTIDYRGRMWTWGWQWGDQSGGQPRIQSRPMLIENSQIEGVMPEIQYVTTGGSFATALDVYGRLWSWGSVLNGQLGGSSSWHGLNPSRIIYTYYLEKMPKIKRVLSSHNHTLAICEDGRILAWGNNSGGIGDGTNENRLRPVFIELCYYEYELPRFKDLATAQTTSIALDEYGRIWTWGSNSNSVLGQGDYAVNTRSPRMLVYGRVGDDEVSLPYFEAISGNRSAHIFAVDEAGSTWGWGGNGSGQIGNGNQNSQSMPTKVNHGITNPRQVFATWGVSFIIDEDGKIWSWGNNDDGRLGCGTAIFRTSPQRLTVMVWEIEENDD